VLRTQDLLPRLQDETRFGLGLFGIPLAGEDGRDPVPGRESVGMPGPRISSFLASTWRSMASAPARLPRPAKVAAR